MHHDPKNDEEMDEDGLGAGSPASGTELCIERAAVPADADLRLDQFWVRELAGAGISRERIKDWIVGGFAKIAGKACRKPGHRLEGREKLALVPPAFTLKDSPGAEDGPLPVLYRDADLVVIDKPADLATHPAPGKPDGTLVNRLLFHFPELLPETSGMEGERPGIVHRLDKDTTGLILVALTEGARLTLSKAFADRRVHKTYLALVHGRPKGDQSGAARGITGEDAGYIHLPIGRHPTIRTKMAVLKKGGRDARTSWRRLWTDRLNRASLLAVTLHTGRTHQIRVHLAHIGHALLGDPVYGPSQHARWVAAGGPLAERANRQMLHAFHLSLAHPVTGEALRFRQDPPGDFLALMRVLGADCLRTVITGAPGCGKSALLNALATLPGGPPTFSADACVAALYGPGGDGAALIARQLGGEMLAPDGSVDRKKLLALLLERPGLRREVEDLIHPLVEHALRAFWAAHASAPLAVAEVPLFFEAGWRRGDKTGLADVVVGLRCPEELRRGVLRQSRNLAPEVLDAFESWQWPAERKLAACDLIVDNAGSLDDLRAEAARLLERLRALGAEKTAAFDARLAVLLDEADAVAEQDAQDMAAQGQDAEGLAAEAFGFEDDDAEENGA